MGDANLSLFDANCTLGRFPTHGQGTITLDALAESLDELGAKRALVRHSLGCYIGPSEANAILASEIAGDNRWIPCWTLNPAQDADGIADLDKEILAVCLYPQSHSYPLCDWMLEESMSPLADRRILTLIELQQTSLPDLNAFCQAYPQSRVIVANTGYRTPGALSRLLATNPNLYIELSTFANYRGIETLAQRHGAHRLLFGTNTPLSDGIGLIAALYHAELSERDRALIAGENLERLLSEVRP